VDNCEGWSIGDIHRRDREIDARFLSYICTGRPGTSSGEKPARTSREDDLIRDREECLLKRNFQSG